MMICMFKIPHFLKKQLVRKWYNRTFLRILVNMNNKQFRVSVASFSLFTSSLIILRRIFTDPFGGVLVGSPAGYSSNFFSAQSSSILHGRLWVNPADLPAECFVYNGQCFGYFGITPSLLRIPLVAQLRSNSVQTPAGFTNVMLSAALILGIASSIWLVDFYLSKYSLTDDRLQIVKNRSSLLLSKTNYLIAILMAGPGNLLLQIARPAAYEEAIAWSIAFFLLAVICVLQYFEYSRVRYLYFSTLFMTLSANSRPSIYLASFTLPLFIWLIIRWFRPNLMNQITARSLIAMFVLPFTTASIICYLKFKTIFPALTLNQQVPEAPHWEAIYNLNGGRDVSTRFIPTNLLIYFNPNFHLQFERFHSLFSYIRGKSVSTISTPVHWLWPISEGQLYVERTVGVFVLNPILIFSITVCVVNIIKSKFKFDFLFSQLYLFLICSFGIGFVILIAVGSSNRYQADFVPWIVFLIIITSLLTSKINYDKPRIGSLMTLLAIILAALSVTSNIIGLSL
jgi:hypothetical protein